MEVLDSFFVYLIFYLKDNKIFLNLSQIKRKIEKKLKNKFETRHCSVLLNNEYTIQ